MGMLGGSDSAASICDREVGRVSRSGSQTFLGVGGCQEAGVANHAVDVPGSVFQHIVAREARSTLSIILHVPRRKHSGPEEAFTVFMASANLVATLRKLLCWAGHAAITFIFGAISTVQVGFFPWSASWTHMAQPSGFVVILILTTAGVFCPD